MGLLRRNKKSVARSVVAERLEDRRFLAGDPISSAALTSVNTLYTRQMEYLDRGVVATRSSSTQVFVSWRLFALDPSNIGFNVYRSANGGAATKLNSSVLTAGTNYTDTNPNLAQTNSYYIKPVVNGIEQAASPAYTLAANSPTAPYFTVPLRNIGNYAIKHMNMADLNGDGKYDYIVNRKPINVVNEVATESTKVEAYLNDGTFLWSVDLGPGSYDLDNIEPGPTAIDIGNWDGVVAYDLDGNGRAEVFLRSANGLVFGDGKIASYSKNNDLQFMSVLDGMTGAELSNVPLPTDYIYEGPMGASFAVGYLDGVHPSLIAKLKNRTGSDNFNQIFTAYDFNGTTLTQKWKHISAAVDSDNGHNIRVVDVDGDGKDEIADTAQVINGDGTLKYNMRYGTPSLGHGDRFYIGDYDPVRPGLEYYGVQQNNAGLVVEFYADAATGEVLYAGYSTTVTDNGRGEIGDIDPAYPGAEFWSFYGLHNEYNSTHTQIGTSSPWPSLGLQWDGDLQAEVLSTDHAVIDQWNPSTQGTSRVSTLYSMGSGATTSDGWPIYYGDVIGDWREEVVYEKGSRDGLVIFSTNNSTSTRLYTLAQNPLYRNNMTTKGYMQTRTLDYYLGSGMTTPPTPNILILGSAATSPTVTTKANASSNPVAGTSVNLSVMAADDAGESSLTYNWTVSGPSEVTFSANGTNAAKNSVATFTAAGEYIFTVKIIDAGGRSALSNVKVIVNQTLTSINVSPAIAAVAGNSDRQFVAKGFDQFGKSMINQPSMTWSVIQGGGSIDATGIYSPNGSLGAAVVKAAVGAISSNATLSINGSAPNIPINLTAVPKGRGQVNLNWTDTANNELGFVIDASTDGVSFTPYGTASANATSYIVAELISNSSYTFRVRSYNTNGPSLPSNYAAATTFIFPDIARWKLDESSGSTVSEESDTGLNGMASNGPTWVSGKIGNAMSFDGVDDYVQLANNLVTTEVGSVSMWVKTSKNFSDLGMLFYMSSDTYGNGSGSQSELHVNFTSAEKIQLYIRGSASGEWGNDVNITSSSSYANNSWHHVAASWDVNGNAVLYVDGVSVGSMLFDPVFTFGNTQRTFLSRTNLNTHKYTGLIDDVRVYNTALTAEQILSITNANEAPSIASPANANPNPTTGSLTSLSVLGVDDLSEAGLTYTWSLIDIPPAPVTFSVNGTNAAKTSTANFTQPGIYNFRVTITDAGGLSTTSTVSVDVSPGPLIFTGTSSADTYRIVANGTSDDFYHNGTLIQSTNRTMISSITFNTLAGNDTLILDYSAGEFAPEGGIVFNAGDNSDTVEVRGSGTIDPFTINSSGVITHGSTQAGYGNVETLKLTTGNFSIGANLGLVNLHVSNALSTILQTQTLGSLTIDNGSAVTSASINSTSPAIVAGTASIDNSTLSVAPNGGISGVSKFSSITITGSGKLDLHDNDLIVDYGNSSNPYLPIFNLVKTGLTLLGGNGNGINSTEVDSQSINGAVLAVVDNGAIGGEITSISGYTDFSSNSILIKYTWFGDSNLDGTVDGGDYALIDSGFTGSGALTGWLFGDYNFDGLVTGDDYALIDTGYIAQDRVL